MADREVDFSIPTYNAPPEHLHRLATNDLEIGATDALQQHINRHVVDPAPVSQAKLTYESYRPRWLRECLAEMTGVFLYVYPGLASTASMVLNDSNPTQGSLLQVGFGYAFGIASAIIICAPTSGGHFNPSFTICFAFWQGFPWKKVPYYIFSQLLGGFLAGIILMAQYHTQFADYAAATLAAGKPLVSANGPAGVLAAFPPESSHNLGYMFCVEFFADAFIALVVWAALDPANPFVGPTTIPLIIGFAFGNMGWAFGSLGLATNTAKDLGPRIVATWYYGHEAFTYKHYAWIPILTCYASSLFATTWYELIMRDSLLKISKGHAVHKEGDEGLQRHLSKTGALPRGTANALKTEDKGQFV
ncbi:MAG: hypothetical protein M1819_000793 [Sarea resinae]|nr:MAG: hypothetical protein M1819_000793 [Sarea resinae]